ncbi:MAG: ABC transporter ATP-binding protein [Actinomycetota bacterium]
MAHVVEVRSLKKHFEAGDVRAVDGVDIATTPGEYLVLLGPSGCGKTTLLRVIAGLEDPTEGDVLIGGNVVNGLPPRARGIAMVFQSYALYPHKTVMDNIDFPLKATGMPAAERRKKVQWAAELLGIARLLGRKPRNLSGGERQRVALARAIVRDPTVFLLDEPLSNLDAKLRTAARDELKQFQERLGTTTIYVTHDQVEAMGLGDRIAVMSEGRVRQIGPPKEVYRDPADTFVATFIGSPPMNLIHRGDHLLGFRPENLLPVDAVNGHGDNILEVDVSVYRIEYLSGDRHVYGTAPALGGEDAHVIARVPPTVDVPIADDAEQRFAIHERDLRFFDGESGERIAARPVRS